MNVLQKQVHVVRFKSMVDGAIRLELDLGELSKTEMAELAGLRTEGIIDMILVTSGEIDKIKDSTEETVK
jgi:hypothetical protein